MSDLLTERDAVIVASNLPSGHRPMNSLVALSQDLWKATDRKWEDAYAKHQRGEWTDEHWYAEVTKLNAYRTVATNIMEAVMVGEDCTCTPMNTCWLCAQVAMGKGLLEEE
jgi:hypothetical protein